MLTAGLAVQPSSVPNPNPIRSMVVTLQTVDSAKNDVLAYDVLYCEANSVYITQAKPYVKGQLMLFFLHQYLKTNIETAL